MLNSFKNTSDINDRFLSAARDGHLEVVTDLLAHGANVEALTWSGANALHLAARGGHLEVVKTLLAAMKGANVAAKNGLFGETALHSAADGGHLEVVKELLAHGANVETANTLGATALHLAAYAGYTEVIKVLLAHDANVEAADMYGKTVLMFAVLGNHTTVIQILLKNQTPEQRQRLFNQVNRHGQNAITLASQENHLEAFTMLQRFGAVFKRPSSERADEQMPEINGEQTKGKRARARK